MNTTAIIPARLSSTRLPRKVLADIHGHPLIWHVWQRVSQAQEINRVVIATDSSEVAEVAAAFGAQVIMTSPDCQSGTERIASVIDQLDGDLILNVQGDEPLIDPAMLDLLVQKWKDSPCDLITPVYQIKHQEDLVSPNVVKVVRNSEGRALYFSRSPIPYLRDFPLDAWIDHARFWGHIGVYGYRREVLTHYYEIPNSLLEQMERLEQLRFLEAGYQIQTIETEYNAVSVDVAADLVKVIQMIKKQNQPG